MEPARAPRPTSAGLALQHRGGPRAQCSIWTRIKITKWPSVKALSLEAAAERYGALYLRDALARFVVQYRNPGLSAAEVEQASLAVSLRFRKIPAFHKLKFALDDAQDLGVMDNTQDVAHARPERKDKQGRTVPGRFDTVLVNDGTGGFSGVQGKSLSLTNTPDPWHLCVITRISRCSAASGLQAPKGCVPGAISGRPRARTPCLRRTLHAVHCTRPRPRSL